MAFAQAGDDLAKSLSKRSMSRRASFQSSSRRSWTSVSIRKVWNNQGDVFQRSAREEDEEELKWAAIEKASHLRPVEEGNAEAGLGWREGWL
ncbi:hypothetical protein SLA2020_470730 [Shorea laevis]